MIGKIYGVEGQKLITVTFNITPTEAKFTLKDRDKKEIQPKENHTYKIAPRKILLYLYG